MAVFLSEIIHPIFQYITALGDKDDQAHLVCFIKR